MSPSWKDERPTVKQLNYAHALAKQLGVENRYQWEQSYWTKGELSALIDGFRKSWDMSRKVVR